MMELKVGSRYKFECKDNSEWFVIEVLDGGRSSNLVRLDEVSNHLTRMVGHEFRMANYGKFFKSYRHTELINIEETDITYTLELINLYIDMALQTLDQKWFDELINMKKAVLA